MKTPFDVLYEDNHLLVINKPAGWVSQGALPDAPSLLLEATDYIRTKYQKPGNVFLGVVSRLDKSVSGVTVIARTSKAAARLSEQFRERDVGKNYWAVVSNFKSSSNQPSASLTLQHWLLQHEDDPTVQVVSPKTPGGKEAILTYQPLLDLGGNFQLLNIELQTGRKHQIRVQLAHIGLPIVGDRKYGSSFHFDHGIMLHARALDISHPTQRDLDTNQPLQLHFTAPLPSSWAKRFPQLVQLSAINA